jgi:ABC-type glycerol-3-phosphate transport system substrate-binding protein
VTANRPTITRRHAIRSAGSVLAGALLPACGARGGTTEVPRTGPAVTLEYWSRWPQPDPTEAEEKRAAEWSAANAPTKVQRVAMTGDYIEKLNTAFAAGAGPDVYTVGGTGIPNFSAKGAALTVGGYAAVQKELPDFFPATIEASKYQGKLNGLPYIVDIRAMIYRKDLFQDAGLDPARFPDTWDAFRDAAKRLAKWEGQALQRAGFDVPKSGWPLHDVFMALHVANGEPPFSPDATKPAFTGASGRQALQLLVDLVNKDRVDAYQRPSPPPNVNVLAAGLVASLWDSAGPVNAIRRGSPEVIGQVGVAPVPRLKQRATYLGGTYLMAASKPKDTAAAVDFMLYLTAGKHADEINGVQNSVPPRRSAAASAYVTQPLIKPFYEAVQHGWAVPNHPFYTQARDAIVEHLTAAVKLEKGVQAALEDAARGAQEFLSRR